MVLNSRSFSRALVFLLVLGFASSALAQPEKPQRMPVSRLAEYQNVRWMAVQSPQKAVVLIQPTITESKVRLKLTIPGYEIAAVRQEKMDFSRFDVPGAGVTPIVGKPELPIVRRFVAVPEGAEVTFKFTAGQPKILENVTVYPVQEPLPEGQPQPGQRKFAMDRNFYTLDQHYPSDLVTVSKPMKMRNVTMVMVEMAVMQYNLVKKTLAVYPGLDVDLSFSKPFTPPSLPVKAPAKLKPSETPVKKTGIEPAGNPEEKILTEGYQIAQQKIFKHNVLIFNPDWIGQIIAHLKWNYLIITPDVYVEEILPLVQWKRHQGLVVHVTKLSEISAAPTPAQIHDHIQKAYEDHAMEYVLLVGDTDTLPGYTYTGGGGTITDYYYTLISGSDYLPDVALGRLSGRTEAEITHMVAKCVGYEKTPAAGTWKTRALCISDSGYFQTTSDYNHDLMETGGFTVDKIYASLGNATIVNVKNAVNEGRLLISYRGHGSETGWATTGFSNADVNALTNGALLPVIISPTCLTGCYDYAISDCFSETWVKSYRLSLGRGGVSTPRGAAAYWGSARVSYGGYNDELSKGAFDDIFTSGNHVIGDVVNNAKLHMLTIYGVADGTALLELHMFNLFGDPGLHINF